MSSDRRPHLAPAHRSGPAHHSRPDHRSGPPHRSRRALASVLTSVLILSGCASSLPTDPVPKQGLPVDVQPRQDVQRLLPRPQPDASPDEIVRGFLRANVGFAEDDDVARDYLTQPLASAWVPTSNVLVVDGSPEISSTAPGTVTVTAQVRGRIDEDGRLVEEQEGTSTTQTFQLAPVQGEWRISTFPEGFGLWLSPQELDTAFRPYKVYYLNPLLDHYVPEVRWLARGEGLHTSLTRAQLGPVPAHLQGAVVTGASSDVRLAVGAVPVDPQTQVATVNLLGTGLGEDAEQVERLRAQLGHSLLALIGVSGLDLRVAGRSLSTGDDGPITRASDLGYSDATRTVDRAVLRRRESVVVVDTTQADLRNATPVPPASTLPNVPATMVGLAASENLDTFAAVSQDRTELWRWSEGQDRIHAGIGDRLTDPTYDPHGLLWVAGVTRGSSTPRLWFADSTDITALARPLEVTGLEEGEQIRAFRVSPDGARALMVVADAEQLVSASGGTETGAGPDDGAGANGAGDETQDQDGSDGLDGFGSSEGAGQGGGSLGAEGGRLLVAGIVRDSAGRPTGLSQPVAVAPPLTTVASARWASPTELLVVGGRAGDQHLVPFRVPLGDWVVPLSAEGGLVDAIPVPAGDGYSPVVMTDDGRFHTQEGLSSWAPARNGDELVIPGS
ncbi:LpqB family beta-propeller domain-containing protein [Ornithinimicrobium panacihumi]|uniref:LpqB family beta-propeller domain-containing protein n=1 Tax=Ornithinimicrobium panacihumi TaxID=2008449 RepID=UPI003F8B0580